MTSAAEERLFLQIRACKLPIPLREYKVCPHRLWRCDFVWVDQKLIVEVEGGIHIHGRHTRPKGFTKDCEKYNYATLQGFKVLRVTPDHIKSGQALQWIEEGLNEEKN